MGLHGRELGAKGTREQLREWLQDGHRLLRRTQRLWQPSVPAECKAVRPQRDRKLRKERLRAFFDQLAVDANSLLRRLERIPETT